jgi:hypothetical protein
VIALLRADLATLIREHGWLLLDADRARAALLDLLASVPGEARAIAGLIPFTPAAARQGVVDALVAGGHLAPLLAAHAPYRYDRPGADPAHAFLPLASWDALLRAGLASADPAVRLDALRLVFASAAADRFLPELAAAGATTDRAVLEAIAFALASATTEAARALRDTLTR